MQKSSWSISKNLLNLEFLRQSEDGRLSNISWGILSGPITTIGSMNSNLSIQVMANTLVEIPVRPVSWPKKALSSSLGVFAVNSPKKRKKAGRIKINET